MPSYIDRRLAMPLTPGSQLALVRRSGRDDDPQSSSASVLIRGGVGSGKTLMACTMAKAWALDLDCDILFVCGETLPREVLAQFEGFASAEGHPDIPQTLAFDLADPARELEGATRPKVFMAIGLRDSMFLGTPRDTGQEILDLARIARAVPDLNINPRVVIVDDPKYVDPALHQLAISQDFVLIVTSSGASVDASSTFDVVFVSALTTAYGIRVHTLDLRKNRFGRVPGVPTRVRFTAGGLECDRV